MFTLYYKLSFIYFENIEDLYLIFLTHTNPAAVFSCKLIAVLFFLMFIRAGLPRYRYDYLTSLGWIKFLLFSVMSLLIIFLIFTLYF